MTTTIGFVHLGPAQHGVTRYGLLLEAAVASQVTTKRWSLTLGDLAAGRLRTLLATADPTTFHLQYSDSLLGGCTDQLIAALAARRDRHRLVVTLHDVPGVAGETSSETIRRHHRYRDVARLADRVVVSSDHERLALERAVRVRSAMIPHLVVARPTATGSPPAPGIAGEPESPATVVAVGYLYPGKGHDLVVDACAQIEGVRVVFAGRPSFGHDHLAVELSRRAEELSVDLHITGWLDDDELDGVLGGAAVPVAPHRSPSASGSIALWNGACRRPIALPTPYARDLLRLAPGCVAVTSGDSVRDLARSIAQAIHDPDSTRLSELPGALGPDRIAGEHIRLYQRLADPAWRAWRAS